jgi:hypothetical protein
MLETFLLWVWIIYSVGALIYFVTKYGWSMEGIVLVIFIVFTAGILLQYLDVFKILTTTGPR